MQSYHWTPLDVDKQPLELLLDIIVVQSKQQHEQDDPTVPVDSIF